MAKQANRMMIGGFVVVAVFIMAASLVVFGSGKFFKKTVTCVLFFNEPVKGLSVGAPVLFQGVQIGSVTSITLQVDPVKMKSHIPVLIEYEPEKFQLMGMGRETLRDPRKNIPKVIDKGLRAQLITQSFITGQLMIQLDFFPGTPVVLQNIDKDYIEIPTIPSTSQKLADALAKLDLEKLEKHLESTLSGVDQIVNDPDVRAGIRGLKDTMQDARKLLAKVERQVDPLAKDVQKTVKDFGKLAREVDPRIKELTASMGKTLSGLDKTLFAVRGLMSQDAPLVVDLESTLKEVSAMSRSLRELTDYLNRHPEGLIRGKTKPGGQ